MADENGKETGVEEVRSGGGKSSYREKIIRKEGYGPWALVACFVVGGFLLWAIMNYSAGSKIAQSMENQQPPTVIVNTYDDKPPYNDKTMAAIGNVTQPELGPLEQVFIKEELGPYSDAFLAGYSGDTENFAPVVRTALKNQTVKRFAGLEAKNVEQDGFIQGNTESIVELAATQVVHEDMIGKNTAAAMGLIHAGFNIDKTIGPLQRKVNTEHAYNTGNMDLYNKSQGRIVGEVASLRSRLNGLKGMYVAGEGKDTEIRVPVRGVYKAIN